MVRLQSPERQGKSPAGPQGRLRSSNAARAQPDDRAKRRVCVTGCCAAQWAKIILTGYPDKRMSYS
jgi:hypothetical protein